MKTIFRTLAIGALSLVLCTPVSADGLAGSYLAARVAGMNSDFKAAAQYYTQAVMRDPSNPDLLENLIISQIGIGKVADSVAVARRLKATGAGSQIADMVLMAYTTRTKPNEPPQFEGAGDLLNGLATAWFLVNEGKMSDALDAFDSVIKSRGLKEFGLYHKSLALALVGDMESADEILSGRAEGPLRATRRGVLAHVQILSQLERNDAALELLNSTFNGSDDPEIVSMRQALISGETLPFDIVRTASDGMAEVFFTFSAALNGDANDNLTLLYARIAVYLRPDHIDAILLTAGLLEALDQHELATEAYDLVPVDHPSFYVAEEGRADALTASGRVDQALEVLNALAKSNPEIRDVHVALGNALRREERYGEATKAYDHAIELIATPTESDWVLFYSRGITHEREKQWPRAEADFRKALELKPGQPLVLNYLGYSFVEKGENLDEALSMIERAVAARPNDGFITDSLGWVFYRLGRFEEAVEPMERAVELTPLDPVINDHLGDVYWAVGRYREAEFQWKRAISFEPEEKDLTRIRRKLEVGLDIVLKEEGADPLPLRNGG
ncbi:MAG: tetratricopeptide repeat protein [Brevirhabdus sp.]